MSDPRFIKHIASNLILNSKEHTETGLVQFRWSIEDTMMKIEVMDTGWYSISNFKPNVQKSYNF